MANTKKGSFEVCIDVANQFYTVAHWCEEKSGSEFLMETLYPFATNISFACELYIKAIMIYRSPDDEFSTGHNIEELFYNLETADQTDIEGEFTKRYTAKTLHEFLNENGNAFVDWRYAHEAAVSINISGYNAFVDALREFVRKLV